MALDRTKKIERDLIPNWAAIDMSVPPSEISTNPFAPTLLIES